MAMFNQSQVFAENHRTLHNYFCLDQLHSVIQKLPKLFNSVPENRNHIHLLAESIAYCVVTSSLGLLTYKFHLTVLIIEYCIQKDPMLLNYKAQEYILGTKLVNW